MAVELDVSAGEIVAAENARHRGIQIPATLVRLDKPGFKSEVSDFPDIYRLEGVDGGADCIYRETLAAPTRGPKPLEEKVVQGNVKQIKYDILLQLPPTPRLGRPFVESRRV